MEFVNCTSHYIRVINEDGKVLLSVPPSGSVARVKKNKNGLAKVAGIPVVTQIDYSINGLPEPKTNTMYLVSGYVRNVLKGKRNDLVTPDISHHCVVIADKKDRQGDSIILGVRRLIKQ